MYSQDSQANPSPGYSSAPESAKNGASSSYQDPMFQGWQPGTQQEQLLSMGVGVGARMVESGLAKYMPGAHLAWSQAKFYFAVNNKYVVAKLKVLLWPFRRQETDWVRMLADDVPSTGHTPASQNGPPQAQSSSTHKYAKPWADVNCPDLYLPLMAFITYVLATGFSQGRSHKFTPETLVDITSHCMVVEVMEILAMRLGVYLLQAPGSLFELTAFSSYKYVGLCIARISSLFVEGWMYYVALLYLGSAMAYFTLKSIAYAVPHSPTGGGLNREIVILVFAVLHFIMFWWIGFF
mmetsp:Transcript_4218/g.5836  ORF Transcript_4218/g.5836 Transcript_4218/m.5836 type:complete len:294 (-) Transcript_4218:209-1090(-)